MSQYQVYGTQTRLLDVIDLERPSYPLNMAVGEQARVMPLLTFEETEKVVERVTVSILHKYDLSAGFKNTSYLRQKILEIANEHQYALGKNNVEGVVPEDI